MWKRLLSALVTVCFLMTVFTGCGESTAGDKKDAASDVSNASDVSDSESDSDSANSSDVFNHTEHLNIALQPIPGYLPVTVMQDNGWLEEALAEAGYDNIRVDYTEFESGPPERDAVTAGSQDIGVMGNVPTIAGVGDGDHLYILGVAYNGPKTEAVIVPNGSGISSVKDLKGKRVGLVVGSIAQDYFSRLLKKAGLLTEDLEIVDLALSAQLDALSAGKVDAIVTWQPVVAKAQHENVGRILADGTDVYKCENLIFGNVEYVELNPEIVQIFFQQYARAAKEVTENREKYAEEYAEKYGLEPAVLESVLETINYQIVISGEDVRDFQDTADWLYTNGIISDRIYVDEFVYDRFANDASVASLLQ